MTSRGATAKLGAAVRMVLAIWIGLSLACASALAGPRLAGVPSQAEEVRPGDPNAAQLSSNELSLGAGASASQATEEREEEEEVSSAELEEAILAPSNYDALHPSARKLPRTCSEALRSPAALEPDTPPPRRHPA